MLKKLFKVLVVGGSALIGVRCGSQNQPPPDNTPPPTTDGGRGGGPHGW